MPMTAMNGNRQKAGPDHDVQRGLQHATHTDTSNARHTSVTLEQASRSTPNRAGGSRRRGVRAPAMAHG